MNACPIWLNWEQSNYQKWYTCNYIYGDIITCKYYAHNCKWRPEFRFVDSCKVFGRYTMKSSHNVIMQTTWKCLWKPPCKKKNILYTHLSICIYVCRQISICLSTHLLAKVSVCKCFARMEFEWEPNKFVPQLTILPVRLIISYANQVERATAFSGKLRGRKGGRGDKGEAEGCGSSWAWPPTGCLADDTKVAASRAEERKWQFKLKTPDQDALFFCILGENGKMLKSSSSRMGLNGNMGWQGIATPTTRIAT